MDLPLSRIRNTFSRAEFDIPKVNKNVNYICLETGCGYQMVSDLEAIKNRGHYSEIIICPGCGASLWKVIS